MSKTIVISIDSLFTEDIEFLKELPNFKEILKDSSIIKNIKCIYPTLTYPCHTSIITGKTPKEHGIYHNERFELNKKKLDWYWYSKDIKSKTIMDTAKENGLTTSSILWPVMGANESIDYNIAEVWAENREDDPRSIHEKSSSKILMDTIYDKHCHHLDWMLQPNMDLFGVACAEDIIKEYKPDLMLIHLVHLDHTRHRNGLFNEKVKEALTLHDEEVGRIINAVKEAGTYEETNFIILGDHGQLSVDNIVYPNVLLKDRGYITVEENQITDYEIYSNSAALSAQILIKNKEKINEVKELFESLKEELFIEKVFTKEEVIELGLDGDFDLVLESKEGISFGNDFEGELVRKADSNDYKMAVASHGHLPTKGSKPPFIAFGPNIKKDIIKEDGDMLCHAPTILKTLGIERSDLSKAFDIVK